MTATARSESFRGHVMQFFGFLVDEFAFVGPELHPYGASFHSPDLTIDLLPYDAAGHYVETFAVARVGERTLRAGLSCLYLHAGLGARGRRLSPRGTPYAISRAFPQQAAALRELLPLLREDDALLVVCHGR